MAGNSFGTLFRFTTWGESHGPAIGVVVDGVPPRIPLAEADIQHWLDKRRPGQSRYTTQRREPDEVQDPVRRVRGADDRHADPAADRECRPALEGLPQHRRPLPAGPRRLHLLEEIRHPRLSRRRPRLGARDRVARRRRRGRAQGARPRRSRSAARWCRSGRTRSTAPPGTGRAVEDNPFWCPDRATAARWADYLDGVRKAGSSAGAVIEIVASGVPAGLGEPVYDKLDGDLARAMMTINAVKGVEIGAGFAAAALSRRGERRRDAHARTARSRSCRTMPAASSAASRPARTSSCASRSSRPARS